ATSHLPGVLMQFLSTRPAVTVTLEPDRPERILEWIIGEQYDCGITDGFIGHPATESQNIRLRSVCIFPKDHHFASKSEIWPEDIVGEKLIHTRRGSAFFVELNQVFVDRGLVLPSWIEIRQFTAACMMVAQGTGVSVVSELDAVQFADMGLDMRPFQPDVVHKLSILRPIAKTPSVVTLEFIETFAESLLPFLADDS
ncbi:MAG: DNA-binding transcriptional LysR family regulator, partial [Paracoccaceae bacterium]